jgi:DNA-directed RNA polymerase specialized sigma24 family protein
MPIARLKKSSGGSLSLVVDRRARAIEEVYRGRYAVFRAALASVVGSSEAAHDVVQESFARALRRRRRYRGDAPLEAWIWKIAVRTALESRRDGRTTVSLDEAVTAGEPGEPPGDPVLTAALRELPPRRKLVVFLRYFADLSYAEIADACGISEGTVAATLAQARAALHEDLTEGARR